MQKLTKQLSSSTLQHYTHPHGDTRGRREGLEAPNFILRLTDFIFSTPDSPILLTNIPFTHPHGDTGRREGMEDTGANPRARNTDVSIPNPTATSTLYNSINSLFSTFYIQGVTKSSGTHLALNNILHPDKIANSSRRKPGAILNRSFLITPPKSTHYYSLCYII